MIIVAAVASLRLRVALACKLGGLLGLVCIGTLAGTCLLQRCGSRRSLRGWRVASLLILQR